jgi:hypothetical protein
MKSKLVVLFLVCFLVMPFSRIDSQENYRHIITGHGPVEGDLFAPKSLATFNNILYVLDQYGVSLFDLSSKDFIRNFPVGMKREDTDNREIQKLSTKDPDYWVAMLKDYSNLNILENMNQMGSGEVTFTSYRTYKIDMNLDSKGQVYILDMGYIQVYDPSSGKLLKTIQLPPEAQIMKDKDRSRYRYTFKIVNDKIFLVKYIHAQPSKSTTTIFRLDIDGVLEDKTVISSEDNKFVPLDQDFTYLPNLSFFCFAYPVSIDTLTVKLFDIKGNEVKTIKKVSNFSPECIEYLEPGKIIMYGMEWKDRTTSRKVLTVTYDQQTDGTVVFNKDKEIISDQFNSDSMDLAVSARSISLLLSGQRKEKIDYQIISIQQDKIESLTTSINQEGQVFASIAFAADAQGNLFESNLINNKINQFSSNGKLLSTITMDPEEIQQINELTPYIRIQDMLIDKNQNLYCTGSYLKNFLYQYSLQDKKWKRIVTDPVLNPLCYNIQQIDDTLFFLDSGKTNRNTPSFYYLSQNTKTKEYTVKPILLMDYPDYASDVSPFFTGFAINKSDYLFLDSVNQEIWIYGRDKAYYKSKINLPKNKDSFYSSLALYPDGSMLVTDTIQCNLVHISSQGEVLEIIGNKGKVVTGTTKETYLENPDQFFVPIKAKIANGNIYVSDLFNCRYHIIPIDWKPEIQWNQQEIKLDKYSIFNSKEINLTFQLKTGKDFPYQISSDAPWIQIKNSTGFVSEKQVSFSVIGWKMDPWQINQNMIHVTFPDYPELNKDFPITVDVVGSRMVIQIESGKATLNDGKPYTLDPLPIIKKGRVFAGLLFFGEFIGCKIDWDNSTKGMTISARDKLISFQIGNPVAIVNGRDTKMDYPPFVKNNHTYLPLRFVCENLGSSVEYEAKTRTITIIYPKK